MNQKQQKMLHQKDGNRKSHCVLGAMAFYERKNKQRFTIDNHQKASLLYQTTKANTNRKEIP